MAVLNAGSLFKSKKTLSIPVYPVPRTVRQCLNIDRAYENGIFRIEAVEGYAMYDRCYLFEDINYINQDVERKDFLLLQFMGWLKSMSTQFKITIANEQRDMESYVSEIFAPLHGEEYPELEKGIGCWIQQKLHQGTKEINRLMYLTVTCKATGMEEAEVFFATLETSLESFFSMLGSRLYRLSGRERLRVLQNLFLMGRPQPDYGAILDGKNDGWKNHILPESIRSHKQYLELGDLYVSVLFGHSFPMSLDEGKVLHDLSNVPFPIYVTVDEEPIDKKILSDKLLSAYANNEKAIIQEMEAKNKNGFHGAGVSYTKNKNKDELEEYMDQVDDNDEACLYIGLLVLVAAGSLPELERRVDQIMRIAKDDKYLLSIYNYRQLKALNTALPVGGRQVNHMRAFLSSAAVALNPFYAPDLQEEKGYLYGLNRTTKHLVIGNRKKLLNPHGILVAHTGSGKSYMIKETEITQTLLLTDDDIAVLDPQNEFEHIIKGYGGQFFDFTPQGDIYLNPFEIPEDVYRDSGINKNKFIAGKVEYALSFVAACMTNIMVTQEHRSIVGKSVRRVYGACFSSGGRLVPTLKAIREDIREQMEDAVVESERHLCSQIINSLEEYTDGVYDMFAHPTNLDIHSRLFGFGLKNVPESIWEPVMVTVMHFLSERIEHNQEHKVATHLIVDETQYLCSRSSSADQLLHAVETYRKFGGIITMAIQNLSRAMENTQLRDMFSNCAYKCFMDQGGIDAEALRQIQDLSDAEFRSLEESVPGQGVMIWGKKIILLDAGMQTDNPLYDMFSTNFHEQAEQKTKPKIF